MKKEVVKKTSSLIFIAKLNIFYLLKNIFDRILVSKEVVKELFNKTLPEDEIIKNELINRFIIEKEIKKILDFPLDIGEKSALSLCLEKNIKFFLSDDKKARDYANSIGIEPIGTLGVILWNLKEKRIDKDYALELIDKLIEKDYYMSSELYSQVLFSLLFQYFLEQN